MVSAVLQYQIDSRRYHHLRSTIVSNEIAVGSAARPRSVIRSRLDARSSEFQSNKAEMEALWGLVADELSKVETIGGQRYVDRHRKRGKMLARERIEQLVDPDTPFLELSPLAGWGSEFPIGAGVVMGIGIIGASKSVSPLPT